LTQPARVSLGGWLVSPRFDLAMFGVPLLLAAASLLPLSFLRGKDIPLPIFLFVIVAFDVSHVWATIYRTYLDPTEVKRRPWLYLGSIPILFLVAFRLHSYASEAFWTVLAYIAIFHFIKQLYGFVAIYRLRAGERGAFDYYLDKWTLWAGALGPVLVWHASPRRQFDWFNAGERFIAKLPPDIVSDLMFVYWVIAAVYVARQLQVFVQKRHFNVGKNLVMVASWISWGVGIGMADSPIISAAFINLLHGIPFLAIVWVYSNRKWHGKDAPTAPSRTRWVRFLTARRHLALFYLLVFGLAIIEEGFWDGLVWRHYLPASLADSVPELAPWILSLAVATLSLPQILHYFLDAFIWKFDGSNPDLKKHLLGMPTPPV